jgi:hypothetical protein
VAPTVFVILNPQVKNLVADHTLPPKNPETLVFSGPPDNARTGEHNILS